MTDTELKALFRTAYSVASGFSIHGSTIDDLAQECVMKVWLKLGDKYNPKHWKLNRRIMKNHLIDKIRMAQRRPDRPGHTPYGFPKHDALPQNEQDVFELASPQPAEIPVPESSERVKRVTLAMIRAKGSLTDASELLGWGYSTTWKAWRDAKREIKEER